MQEAQGAQGAEGASSWLALELCPGLSTAFGGSLGPSYVGRGYAGTNPQLVMLGSPAALTHSSN